MLGAVHSCEKKFMVKPVYYCKFLADVSIYTICVTSNYDIHDLPYIYYKTNGNLLTNRTVYGICGEFADHWTQNSSNS